MNEGIQFILVICGINIALLLFAIFTFKVGKKIHYSGETISRTGSAPAGSGFYGGLDRDIKTNPLIGYIFILTAYCWYIGGLIALIISGVLDIIVIYKLLIR